MLIKVKLEFFEQKINFLCRLQYNTLKVSSENLVVHQDVGLFVDEYLSDSHHLSPCQCVDIERRHHLLDNLVNLEVVFSTRSLAKQTCFN